METDGVGGGVGGDGGGLMGRGEGVDGGCCEGKWGGRSCLTWARYVVTMQGTIERVDSFFRSVESDSSVARLTKVPTCSYEHWLGTSEQPAHQ